jgi:HSP20 family protein
VKNANRFNDVVKGLDDLLEIAATIVNAATKHDQSVTIGREGSTRTGAGVHGIYGVSVRIGAHGAPVFARFGNVRRTARDTVIDEAREPIADLFDETDFFVVVAEMPGIDEAAVRWTLRNGTELTVRAESPDRKYLKTLTLPAPVDEHAGVSCYANGVLELKLWKRR